MRIDYELSKTVNGRTHRRPDGKPAHPDADLSLYQYWNIQHPPKLGDLTLPESIRLRKRCNRFAYCLFMVVGALALLAPAFYAGERVYVSGLMHGFLIIGTFVALWAAIFWSLEFRRVSKTYRIFANEFDSLREAWLLMEKETGIHTEIPSSLRVDFFKLDADFLKWASETRVIQLIELFDMHMVMLAGQNLLLEGLAGKKDSGYVSQVLHLCRPGFLRLGVSELRWNYYFAKAVEVVGKHGLAPA